MRHVSRVLLAAALALPGTAPFAQDVMKAAPGHYKVLVDNAEVRVVENTLAPGEKDAEHTHPAGWYYVTAPGSMKVRFADGRTEMWQPKLGESGWMEAEGPHTSENVGPTRMGFILVEVKAVERDRARTASP